MTTDCSVVALIPARSGSERVPNKNIKLINGRSLIERAVQSAIESGVFKQIICVTDNEEYAAVARSSGATVPELRPSYTAGAESPDISWVRWIIDTLAGQGQRFQAYAILRPTSPFRTSSTIKAAWLTFAEKSERFDSLRGMSRCEEHPGKMWIQTGDIAVPLLPFSHGGIPWHSNQTKVLPPVLKQNACLELSWVDVLHKKNSISGDVVMPYLIEGVEAFDINTLKDFEIAEQLANKLEGKVKKNDIS